MIDQSTFKKEKLKDEHFEVVRTRKHVECGLDEKMRWLALHPSLQGGPRIDRAEGWPDNRQG